MSHEQIGFCTCPEIQDNLNSYFTKCDPAEIIATKEVGLVNFLNSTVNKSGIFQKQITDAANGKQKILELSHSPRIVPSEVSTNCLNVCSSNNPFGNQCTTYQMGDDCLEMNWFWRLSDMKLLCEDNFSLVSKAILANMSAIIRRLDEEYSTAMIPFVGNFAAGETNTVGVLKTIQTQKANNDIDTNGLTDITFAAENASYCTIPYIIGWNEIARYMKRLKAGCCADQGIDISTLVGMNDAIFIPDYNIEGDFGAGEFLTMAAGAVQPLFWNDFAGPTGINSFDTPDYKQTVLKHPEFDVPFDFIFNVDCGQLNFQLKINWDLEGMPADMFFAGDNLDGGTFVNEYIITNP